MDTAPARPFVHHGRTGPMVRLVLVNTLLNLVTLSLYRFWGNTQVRRRLWSETTLWGDPLEYTGTGRELFLGFLVVFVVILLPMLVAAAVLADLAETGDPLATVGILLIELAAFFLAGVGVYRARRYRLSRTLWRGIRCGQDGSAWRYGGMFVAAAIANSLSFGWAWPATEMWLQQYKLSNTRIGSARLDCTAIPEGLYKPFALCWLLAMVLVAAAALGGSFLVWAVSQAGAPQTLTVLLGGAVAVAAVFALAWPFAIYRRAVWRHLARHTSLHGARFAFSPGIGQMLMLGLVNSVLTVATLGLFLPVAALRIFRFAGQHLEVTGQPDFAAITQGGTAEDGSGEGLAAAFDGAGAL